VNATVLLPRILRRTRNEPADLTRPYCVRMAKLKKPGSSDTPHGSPEGPPGKKQKSKARRSKSRRGRG